MPVQVFDALLVFGRKSEVAGVAVREQDVAADRRPFDQLCDRAERWLFHPGDIRVPAVFSAMAGVLSHAPNWAHKPWRKSTSRGAIWAVLREENRRRAGNYCRLPADTIRLTTTNFIGGHGERSARV